LPAASYYDPAPANTANYDGYLSQMTVGGDATGIAGSLPLQSVDPTAGSASVGGWSYNLDSTNYNFTAPVLSLPGRAGLGVTLAMSYNSRVWVKHPGGGAMAFNPDRGFPAPGWRIGFGAIQARTNTGGSYSNSVTGKQSYIYIAPDGTRHDLAYNSSTGYYESYNSSYIRFEPVNRVLQMPNGTRAYFQIDSMSNSTNQFLPNYVIDRNGNFINIYYQTLSNGAVVIQYLIDTAGRRVDFNYQNNRLVSVSQNRNSVTFYYLRLDYQPITIQTNFYNMTTDPVSINGTQVYFPVRITFPTGINYRFGYTSYGQINTIQKWVPTITGQGNEWMIASTTLLIPSYDPNYAQVNCPSFSQRNEWAERWQAGNSQAYLYSYNGPAGHEVRDPTSRRFRVHNTGTAISVSVLPAGSDDSTKKDVMIYTSDSGVPYASNLRVIETKSTANTGTTLQIKHATFSYIQRDGMWLVENKDEYGDFGIGLYRRTNTTYTSKPAQYILGLPEQVSVHDSAFTLISRITNNYDETGAFVDSNNQIASYFIDSTSAGVIQHDNTNYGFNFSQRGNLTSVTQYKVENGAVTGSRIVKRVSYDTNGNVRAETDGAGNRKQIDYSDYYSNKPAGVGQTQVHVNTAQDPIGFRSGSQWDYYTGLTVKTFNLAPGSSTETQVVTTDYDFADRPRQTTRLESGAWVKTAYWDNWLATATSQLVDTGKVRYKFEEYDGAGRAYRKASDHPDGVFGKYSGQISVFDKVGQVQDSSNAAAMNVQPDGNWTPVDGDAFLYTQLTRDELGRLKAITLPDTNTKQFDYTGCGCAGNSETRITDELGHYTITRTDFLGRLIEAIEPNPDDAQNIYSRAVYIYDAQDRLIRIEHYGNYNPVTGGTPVQYRYFSYDGYGRLSQENTPEAGIVTYTYTANDQLQTKTDARGITTTFGYNTRNLTASISYSDGTPGVTFGYDGFGARQTMSDGEGMTSYSYNSLRQLQSESRTFTGLMGNTYTLNYTYNLADQLKSVNYLVTTGATPGEPATYGHFGPTWQPPYTISGQVTNQQGQTMSDVTVTMSGGASGQATTGKSGQFSFGNLQTGDYTLTPSLSGYVFTPSSITYLGLQRNWTNANFTAMPELQTVFNKTVNYDYNSVGALSGVGTNLIGSDPNNTTNVLNSLTFRASGALSSLNYGNGRRLTMGYNANRQQPISMKVDHTNNPSDKIIDYVYDYYDANGKNNNRIRKITDNVDPAYTTDYSYDDYKRLTNAQAGAYFRFYYYDRWGNITNFSAVAHTYATNASGAPATNRIISDGLGVNYSYDAAGNMTQAGATTYGYDGASRLKSVNGTLSTYGYDGDGRRVRVTDGGVAVYYVYSSKLGQVAMEVNSSGLHRAYIYSGNHLVAQQSTDGQFYWLHTNHLGSARAMTDVNGNLVYRGQFDPFGQTLMEWSSSGNTNLNTKKFTGYERDAATGLDYARARMYTSSRGRFMQPDPMGLAASAVGNPQSLNRYSYVRNDPINFVDPNGLEAKLWICYADPWHYEERGNYWWRSWHCYEHGGGGGGGVIREDQQRDQRGGGQVVDSWTKEQKRRDALNKAKNALGREDCKDLIAGTYGEDPLGLLNTLDKNGQFNESPEETDYFKDPENWATPAFTTGLGEAAQVKLVPDIDIREPSRVQITGFYSKNNYAQQGVPSGLDVDTQRAILFLHELSHATGKFKHKGDNHPGQEIDHSTLNKDIYEKCIK
jgi:RHS repeat-associated protein